MGKKAYRLQGEVAVVAGMTSYSRFEQRADELLQAEHAEVSGQHHNDLYPCALSRPDGHLQCSRRSMAAATSG